jgi:hypothetical protein
MVCSAHSLTVATFACRWRMLQASMRVQLEHQTKKDKYNGEKEDQAREMCVLHLFVPRQPFN